MPEKNDRPIGRTNAVVARERRLIPWIWEGVVAAGAVTLLSAPEKVGKTTLLSLLLDRRRAGGDLLGRTVSSGKTVLCSEENERLWALRQPPLDFGLDHYFSFDCEEEKVKARQGQPHLEDSPHGKAAIVGDDYRRQCGPALA